MSSVKRRYPLSFHTVERNGVKVVSLKLPSDIDTVKKPVFKKVNCKLDENTVQLRLDGESSSDETITLTYSSDAAASGADANSPACSSESTFYPQSVNWQQPASASSSSAPLYVSVQPETVIAASPAFTITVLPETNSNGVSYNPNYELSYNPNYELCYNPNYELSYNPNCEASYKVSYNRSLAYGASYNQNSNYMYEASNNHNIMYETNYSHSSRYGATYNYNPNYEASYNQNSNYGVSYNSMPPKSASTTFSFEAPSVHVNSTSYLDEMIHTPKSEEPTIEKETSPRPTSNANTTALATTELLLPPHLVEMMNAKAVDDEEVSSTAPTPKKAKMAFIPDDKASSTAPTSHKADIAFTEDEEVSSTAPTPQKVTTALMFPAAQVRDWNWELDTALEIMRKLAEETGRELLERRRRELALALAQPQKRRHDQQMLLLQQQRYLAEQHAMAQRKILKPLRSATLEHDYCTNLKQKLSC